MTFGDAVGLLKQGKSVGRAGWNGKKMYVYLEWYSPSQFSGRVYAPCLVMFTAQGTHQPGWNASTADVLAEDWEVVDHT